MKRLLTILLIVVVFPVVSFAFDKKAGELGIVPPPEQHVYLYDEGTITLKDVEPPPILLGESIGKIQTWGTGWGYVEEYIGIKHVTREVAGVFGMQGTAFFVSETLAVTAAHCVVPIYIKIRESENSSRHTKIYGTKTISIDISGNPAHIVFVDDEHDIAVVEVENPMRGSFKPLQFSLSVSCRYYYSYSGANCIDAVEKGDVVVLPGRLRTSDGGFDWRFQLKWGKITSPGTQVPSGYERAVPWFSMEDFTMDVNVIPGDSGSPIIAFDNGRPVVIGVARAGFQGYPEGRCFTYAARIDILIPVLRSRGVKVEGVD